MTRKLVVFLAWALLLLPAAVAAEPPAVSRVAVCPLTIHSREDLSYLREGLLDVFASRLRVDGALVPVEKARVQEVLGTLDPPGVARDALRAAMDRLGTDYLVYGSLTQLGESISLDLRLLSADGGEPRSFSARAPNLDGVLPVAERLLDEVRAAVLPNGAPPPAPTARSSGGGTESPSRTSGFDLALTLELPPGVRGVAVGDVDGDGRNEIVAASATNVYVHRLSADALELLAEYDGKAYEDFIHLDLADLDGDGAAEIFVTSLRDGPRALVLDWRGGSLGVIAADLPYFLRAFPRPDGSARLVGQEYAGDEWPFGGARYEFRFRDGRYGPGERIEGKLPLYHYLPLDLDGDGVEEIVVLDGDDHLLVLPEDGRPKWTDGNRYGGSCIHYEMPPPDDDMPRNYVEIPVSMVAVGGSSAESAERLVVVRNNPVGSFNPIRKTTRYDGGDLIELRWAGGRLVVEWEFEGVPGCITDLQVGDPDNDGRDDLVVASVATTQDFLSLSAGASSLRIFRRPAAP